MFAAQRDLVKEHPRCKMMSTNTPKRKGRKPIHACQSSPAKKNETTVVLPACPRSPHDDRDPIYVTRKRLSKGRGLRSGGKRQLPSLSSPLSPHDWDSPEGASERPSMMMFPSSSSSQKEGCLPWTSADSAGKTSCASSFLESSERSTATTVSCSSTSTIGSLQEILLSPSTGTNNHNKMQETTTPTRRRRVVRFKPRAQTRSVLSLDELSDQPKETFWYQPYEFEAINKKIVQIVAKVRSDGNDPIQGGGRKTIICTRGLERVMASDLVKQVRMQAVHSVLALQAAVGGEHGVRGSFASTVAEQYMNITQECVDEAIEQARIDEDAANAYYSKQ